MNKELLLHIPCKNIYEQIKTDFYDLQVNGNIYDDEEKGIYGGSKLNDNLSDYSKLILINKEKYSIPITIEFYANIDTYNDSYNKFIQITYFTLYDRTQKQISININNIEISEKIELDKALSSGYYIIKINNNGYFALIKDEDTIYSDQYEILKDVIIDKIEFYLGFVEETKIENEINIYSSEYQNDAFITPEFDIISEITHNIYYKDIKITTNENFIGKKFRYRQKNNSLKYTLTKKNKYTDKKEIVNIRDSIKDLSLINKNFVAKNINTAKDIFNKDNALYFTNYDSTIITQTLDNITINDFTIEFDLKINKFNEVDSSIFYVYGKDTVIQMMCNNDDDYCIFYFSFKNLSNEYECYYDAYYDYIYNIIITKNNNILNIFINGENIFNNDIIFSTFKYDKTVLGYDSIYESFHGYLSNFIFSNEIRYNNKGLQINNNLNNLYEYNMDLISIHKEFNTYRQLNILFPRYSAVRTDDNHLIYVDFLKNKIENKGKLNNIDFEYISEMDENPIFIDKQFPGDSYAQALVVSPKSKLNMTPLDLSSINKFTIELDFKLLCKNNIKLFTNDEQNIYMSFEDDYLIFNIKNSTNQIQLKTYRKFKENSIVNVALQRINNIFYLIINKVLVYIGYISNLSNLIIDTIYENDSFNSIMCINRYSILNIARYDLESIKSYPLDSQTLIYLPCNEENNIIKSEDNDFDIDTKIITFNKNYFKLGYGSITNGSTVTFKQNKKENFSLSFWHRLIANNTILSNLNCTILRIKGKNSNDVFEMNIADSHILVLKSYNIKEESISINITDKTKGLYNIWNNFAITFNIEAGQCIFIIFLNGKQIHSQSLKYFNSDIDSITLFTEYTAGKVTVTSPMHLSSIRLSKGIYYNQDFYPTTTGLLYKSFTNDKMKPKIIYSKYPQNNIDFNASQIFNKYTIFIENTLSYYFTFECWMYTTENEIYDNDPMCIKFIKEYKVLYTLYLTKDDKNKYIRTENSISKELFKENQWTHIALTYSKDNNTIKIWINGNLIITEKSKISLIESDSLELYPGSGNSYFNDLLISSSLKYINKNFMPPNVLLQNNILEYDKYQDIPYIIYNKHNFGDIENCTNITNTKFIYKLTNYSGISHFIEFWLYVTKNTVYSDKPLFIDIFDNKDNCIHKIILSRYIADNTDNIHWDKNITDYQVSNVVLPEKIWTHFALIYNKNKNKIQFYCNGIKILESEFKLVISLKTLSKIIITPSSSGETYIDGFLQTQYIVYEDNFVPKNGKISGSYLPLQQDTEENVKNTDRIGILDDNYITYLDFENKLEDRSKYNVIWNSYGFLQYIRNVFPYDKDSNSILLDGSNGIYTNDQRLNLSNLDKFTIELEIKNYTDFVEQMSMLFVNFCSWIVIYLTQDGFVKIKYNCENKKSFSLSSEQIDLDDPIYVALQKTYDIIYLYINGNLSGQIKINGKLENYLNLTDKKIDHVIDIGMVTTDKTKFFNGYINKIAISDIARFDDEEMDNKITIPKIEKNENIIFYQPIKYPACDNIYKTVSNDEQWDWKYRRRNTKVYSIKMLSSSWQNYRVFGPSENTDSGFIEYSSGNIDLSHRSFTFEFLMYKKLTKEKCNLLSISNILFYIEDNSIIINEDKISMGYNELENNYRYFIITYNSFTNILNLFINGKLLYTNEYNNLLPVPIRLYTNSLSNNPIYFSSIRLSKGILFTDDNFDISFIKQPYTDYNESNLINNEHKSSSNDTVLYLLSDNDINNKSRYTFSINNTKIYER